MQNFNFENAFFKPFKKGDKLLNNILSFNKQEKKIFIIFSTSKCKSSKSCTLSIDLDNTTTNELSKLENLLRNYTWNLSNTLKTTENGISYTFKTLLNRYNINISYNIYMRSNKSHNKKLINNLILIIPIKCISI